MSMYLRITSRLLPEESSVLQKQKALVNWICFPIQDWKAQFPAELCPRRRYQGLTFVLTFHFISRTTAMWKPLSYVYAVFQWHQKALHHRKFQLLTVSDDHHVGAGQSWAQVIQMDPAVIGHQPHSKSWLVSFIGPKTMRQNSHAILLP